MASNKKKTKTSPRKILSTLPEPKEGESIGEYRKVDSIHLSPMNVKKHSDEKIAYVAGLIEQFGFGAPLVVDDRGEIIAGHARYRAALKLGMKLVPVRSMSHLSPRDAQLLRLADNRSAEILSEYDDQIFAQVLRQLWDEDDGALASIGYEDAQVSRIIDAAKRGNLLEEKESNAPIKAPPKNPRTKAGNVWILGNHRLLCGDSMKRDVVIPFMKNVRPPLMFTDPPYGVMHGRGGLKGVNAIRGDLSQAAIPISFALALDVLATDARIYMCGGSENVQMYWTLFDYHLHLAPHPIVWVKDGFVLRRHNYHSQMEFIYFGWKEGGGDKWFGDRKQSDVWQVPRKKVTNHPTEKPPELAARAMQNSSRPGDEVFEPFCGSGSTLIAAEQLERKCYAIELDPGWCDVIVDRWEKITGKKGKLAA